MLGKKEKRVPRFEVISSGDNSPDISKIYLIRDNETGVMYMSQQTSNGNGGAGMSPLFNPNGEILVEQPNTAYQKQTTIE